MSIKLWRKFIYLLLCVSHISTQHCPWQSKFTKRCQFQNNVNFKDTVGYAGYTKYNVQLLRQMFTDIWPTTVGPLHNIIIFLKKYSQRTVHSSPVRASYGVSFVSSRSELFPSLVIITQHVILCYDRQCCKEVPSRGCHSCTFTG